EEQFLQTLLAKFGIEAFNANKANLLKLLNDFFVKQHAKGRKVLLIVDEAHHLGREILEEIRFLTGIEIGGEEIFTCILVGHTELMEILDAPGMEQLSQRVRLRFHIPGLSEDDIRAYIKHRLKVAGHDKPGSIFPKTTLPLIHEYTGGIPRLINILCDASMIAAYAEDVDTIDDELIKTAIEELQWGPYQERQHKNAGGLLSVVSEGRRPRIILTQNGELIEEIQLDKRHISIGRRINNDITLGHRLVSRYHAQISVDGDQVVLEDLGSINGTYVNGKRTKSCVLRNHDRIRIGPFELELVTNPSHQTSNETTKLMMVPGNPDLS
ncbi:MAG: FHA domain-containing protein, partial [Gammaproteobacteria bacterium]|nr:FHA domain-containing protein [Gammaproteobacteria bacterium]